MYVLIMCVCVCVYVCVCMCTVWNPVLQGCRNLTCYTILNVIDEGTYGIVCKCVCVCVCVHMY